MWKNKSAPNQQEGNSNVKDQNDVENIKAQRKISETKN